MIRREWVCNVCSDGCGSASSEQRAVQSMDKIVLSASRDVAASHCSTAACLLHAGI